MPFEKGHKKVGGRKKGTPNVKTKELRDFYAAFLKQNMTEVQKLFDDLKDPKDKLSFFLAVSEFIAPKISRQEVSQESGDIIVIRPSR